ncbi:hypothetical protein EYF80_056329 [Liparis tanakae]|uniref:Uncharacterized protein n=1 Tax=Liparis tanakae TaxID=230148 RepID=A0A4Z2EXG7_9TELE|nr:hypothetical protein EYF80_056329 [Liparis tanakae]
MKTFPSSSSQSPLVTSSGVTRAERRLMEAALSRQRPARWLQEDILLHAVIKDNKICKVFK